MSEEIIKEIDEDKNVGSEGDINDVEENNEPIPLSIEEQLVQALRDGGEYKEKWQRARAEFANAKKRMEKERLTVYSNALADVLQKVLPAFDDFDRAFENVPASIAKDSWFEGVGLALRKMEGILDGLNVEKIPAVGEPFDPIYHEAVMGEESDEYDAGIVTKELQTGYKRGELVIRPALVMVAN